MERYLTVQHLGFAATVVACILLVILLVVARRLKRLLRENQRRQKLLLDTLAGRVTPRELREDYEERREP